MRNVTTIATLIICFLTRAQIPFDNYINEFPEYNGKSIISTFDIIGSGNKMDKGEATYFIYSGDSSKIICTYEEFNMLTEEVVDTYTAENLPLKTAKIQKDSITFLFVTYNSCPEKNDFEYRFLKLFMYVDNKLIDTLIIHKEDDYEYETASLINIEKNTIFRYNINTTIPTKEFRLFNISLGHHSFEEKKFKSCLIPTNDLKKTLDKLGWTQYFY